MEKHTKSECLQCAAVLLVYNKHTAVVEETREIAKRNFYGCWVCSRKCDINHSLAMESSMPGAGPTSHPGNSSMKVIKENWGE